MRAKNLKTCCYTRALWTSGALRRQVITVGANSLWVRHTDGGEHSVLIGRCASDRGDKKTRLAGSVRTL